MSRSTAPPARTQPYLARLGEIPARLAVCAAGQLEAQSDQAGSASVVTEVRRMALQEVEQCQQLEARPH